MTFISEPFGNFLGGNYGAEPKSTWWDKIKRHGKEFVKTAIIEAKSELHDDSAVAQKDAKLSQLYYKIQ